MGNECSKLKCHRRNRTEEPTQQGTELENLPPARVPQSRTRDIRGSNNLLSRIPLNAPERQTQTVGQQKSILKEVAGEDFNKYIKVDKIEAKFPSTDTENQVGHSFLVDFHVTNTTSDTLKFTSCPPLEWKEVIHQKDGAGETETEQVDKYVENSMSATFTGWRWGWNEEIEPNQTKTISITDNARMSGFDKNKRTVSRSIEFDIGVPNNGTRLKATQNIEVVDGVKKKSDFKIH